MNRAWIPAAALAGVSVAGLIALGPLTDSLNTKVPFPTGVTTEQGPQPKAFVHVSYNKTGSSGTTTTKTAAGRGGKAGTMSTTSEFGYVADKRQVVRSTHSSTATAKKPASSTTTTTKPKKAPPRQKSIGSVGETNGDSGFAGGSSGSTGLGEQTSTPGNATP